MMNEDRNENEGAHMEDPFSTLIFVDGLLVDDGGGDGDSPDGGGGGNGGNDDSGDAGDNAGNQVSFSDRDPLFHAFLTAPLVLGATLLVVGIAISSHILLYAGIGFLSFGIFVAAFGVVRVRKDVLAARQLFRTGYYRNCLAIAFWLDGLRKLIGIALFPGSQNTFESPSDPAKKDEPNALIVPFKGEGGNVIRQLVPFQAAWRLDIKDCPQQLVMSYQRELITYGNTEGFKRIVEQVNVFIKGKAFAVLSGQDAALFFSADGLKKLNDELTKELTNKLKSIGVVIDETALEQFVDIMPNGFVAIEEQKELARQEKAARVVTANEKRDATLAEQDARIEILKKEQAVIKKQLANELERVKIGIADLKARLSVFSGKSAWKKTLLKRLDDVPVEQLVALANAFAEALKAAGLNPQGALLLAGDGGSQVLNATSIGALAAIFEKFLSAKTGAEETAAA